MYSLLFKRIAVLLSLIFLLQSNVSAQSLSTYINSVIGPSGLNLTLNSVTFYTNVTSLNVSEMRDSVFYNWVYPDGLVSGEKAIVSNVYKIGEQTGLDTAKVSAHYSFLSSGAKSLQAGDKLYRCSYTLIDSIYGTFNFTTMGYEDASGNAKFEPFISMCPLHFSDYIKVTKPGAAHDAEFEVKNGFGVVAASGWGDCKVTCNGNTVVDCFGLVGGDASFLWDYETTKDCATVENCCRCIFRFGFANGFSSVGVGVDGVSIELSGSFGWKGSTETVVKRCCPTGAMVAFNFNPQTSGTSLTLYSVSTQSGSTAWVSGAAATVLRTTNGGANWINASGPSLSGDVYNIFGLDMNTAFCTTTPGSSTFIYKTTNGGSTWNQVFAQSGGFIDAIEMISHTVGFALGDPVGGKWTVLRTNDGGNSWTRMPNEPVVIGSQNGWNNSFHIEGNRMWFGTNTQQVYFSNDLGNSWNFSNTPGTVNSYAVHFNSMNSGLAGGTGLVKTTNGGMSYSIGNLPVTLSNIYGLEGAGPEWWAVGTNMSIYYSANAGNLWQNAYTYTLDVNSGTYLGAIDLTDNGFEGWVVGSGGEIIRIGSVSQEVSVSLSAYIEGFYDQSTNMQTGDTIKAYLRNSVTPFALVDSCKAYLDQTGNASLNFPHASTGNYYLVLSHRNSIETWSAAGISVTEGSVTGYDLTAAATQAYGSNLQQVDISPVEFAVYGGDVNQDETIDATDLSQIDNDAFSFVAGYVVTDLTGDNFVDATDYSIADNNAYNFISVISP